MSNRLKILVVLTLIMIVLSPLVSAVTEITVVKKELIDSQYGVLTDYLGIGTQIYKITYSDGRTEQIAETGKGLSLGAITEMPSGTGITSTVCYNAKTDIRVKTIQDSANSFTESHRIEIYYNPFMMSYPTLVSEAKNDPSRKVYDSGIFTASATLSKPLSIEIPYMNFEANIERLFLVVESQMKKDGTWVTLPNQGFSTTSTYTSIVKWWDTYQAGTGIGSLAAGTCMYTVPKPPVASTPTPPLAVSTRTIQVTSSPSGATVTSSGQTLGTTPFSLTLDSSSAKILTFNLAGYTSSSKGVDINTISPVSEILTAPASAPTPQPTQVSIPQPTQAPVSAPTAAPAPGQPVVTTVAPAQTSTGGATIVTYEEPSLLTSTNIIIVIVIAVIGIGGYKLYVQVGKGKKGKRRG